MTALAARPEDLRLAARELQVARHDLEELAGRLVREAAGTAGGWQGVAALGHRAATQRVVVALRCRSGPVGEVATALSTLADQAETARAGVLEARGRRDQAVSERIRQIRLLQVVTDPVGVEAIRARIVVLDTLIRRAEDDISWAEERLEQGRRIVERVVRDSWPGFGVDDLRDLVGAGKDLAPAWRGGGLVVVGTRVLLTTVRLGRDLNPFVRYQLEARLATLIRVVRKPPVVYLLTRLSYRIVIPVAVISDAWPDVRDGGGYDGWRGVTLRVTAALAIPGSVAMVMPHPVVAGVGSVTVGAYYLAKAGYALWDHRLLLAQVGATVYARRHEIIRTAKRVLAPSPAFPLGPLGPMAPMVPDLRKAVSGLPRLGELGRLLPALGQTMPVMQAPIEIGPRLPAIPPASLGPIGVGILLPSLGRLF